MSSTRRTFLRHAAAGRRPSPPSAASAGPASRPATRPPGAPVPARLDGLPHFKPKAKRVIVLWQGGGASHVDLYDHKPGLEQMRLKELPDGGALGRTPLVDDREPEVLSGAAGAQAVPASTGSPGPG